MNSKMYSKDHFIIVEGIDGCGKGTIVNALAKELSEKYKLKSYDIRKQPRLNFNAELIISAEPSYFETGLKIREFLKEIEQYDKKTVDYLAELFSNDRLFLYQKILLPALEKDHYVIQERSVISSLVYQGYEYAFLKGNKFALQHPATVFILDVDPEIAMNRLNKREKKDQAYFERLDFLKRIRMEYLSETLYNILKKNGFNVYYIKNNADVENSMNKIKSILNLE